MINLNKENEDVNNINISSTTELIDKQLELQKLELEIKRLEIKKLELEQKDGLAMKKTIEKVNTEDLSEKQDDKREIVRQNDIENIPYSTKPNFELKMQRKANLKKYSLSAYEEKRKEKLKKKKRLVILVSVFLIFFCLRGVSNYIYFNSIEPIFNPEDYYMLTRDDIVAMYGEPEKPYVYDFGEYRLNFSFEHGYVSFIIYTPDEGFKYRNSPKNAFYLFGLEDKVNSFKYEKIPTNIFRAKNDNYITTILVDDDLYAKNTADHVTVFFKENFPDREVFEGDFTDVPVMYDLVQYLEEDREYVYKSLGPTMKEGQEDIWYYYTEYGGISIFFVDDKVRSVDFVLEKPIYYQNSVQEIMVMFGVSPKQEDIYLDDYYYGPDKREKGYPYFSYEKYKNFKGKNSKFSIVNIDRENKTFEEISIFSDSE